MQRTGASNPANLRVLAPLAAAVVVALLLGSQAIAEPISARPPESRPASAVETAGIGPRPSAAISLNATVVANISVGSSPTRLAYDPADGEVFVSNFQSSSVSVVNTTYDTVVSTVGVGGYPRGLAYDPTDHNVYVANNGAGGGSTVSVIATTNNTDFATISVGSAPQGVLYDPANSQILVSNGVSASVSAIYSGNQTVASTIGVGTNPWFMAYDPASGDVYVADGGYNRATAPPSVSIVSSADVVATSVSMSGVYPFAMVLDGKTGDMYSLNGGNSNITILSAHRNSPIGSIALTAPSDGAYDPTNGIVYVTEGGTSTVAEISGASNQIVGNITLPASVDGVVYDPVTEQLFVTDGNSVSVVDVGALPSKVPITCVDEPLGGISGGVTGSLGASYGNLSGSASASVSASLTAYFQLCLAIHGRSFSRLSASVTLYTNASLGFTLSGGYQRSSGSSPLALSSPVDGPLIYIPGTFLVFLPILTPVLIYDISAVGSMSMSATENSSTTLGENWSSTSGWSPIFHAPTCLNGASPRTLCFQPSTPKLAASASLSAEIGLQVALELYGIAGPELTFGPYVQLSAAAGSLLQPTPCGGLELGTSIDDWYGACGGFAVSAGASVGLFGYAASTYTLYSKDLTTSLIFASVNVTPASSKGMPYVVAPGSSTTLTAAVGGNASLGPYAIVDWSLSGTGCGTLNATTGYSVSYLAPASAGALCKITATVHHALLTAPLLGLDQSSTRVQTS